VIHVADAKSGIIKETSRALLPPGRTPELRSAHPILHKAGSTSARTELNVARLGDSLLGAEHRLSDRPKVVTRGEVAAGQRAAMPRSTSLNV
jgi:hypothetical protein